MLANSWRLVCLAPLVAGLTALGLSFFITPTYKSTTRILPPAMQQSTTAILMSQLGSLSNYLGGSVGVKNIAEQYVGLLRSQTVFDAIIRRFDLKKLYDERYIEDARRQLERRTTISAGVKDGLILIEIEDTDPQRAANMANAFVEELRNLSNNLAIGEAAQRRQFFESQLQKTQNDLTQAEIALRGSSVSEALLKTIPQSALEALARLKAQITAQEIRLASMKAFMTEANPEFRLALKELDALRSELSKAEQSKAAKPGSADANYVERFRNFKYHEVLFELMAKQYELARLDEAREGTAVQVVDEARPPERKSKPRRGLIAAITAIVTLVFAVPFVITRVRLRDLRAGSQARTNG